MRDSAKLSPVERVRNLQESYFRRITAEDADNVHSPAALTSDGKFWGGGIL